MFGESEAIAREFMAEVMVEKTINKKTVMVRQRGGFLMSDPEGKYQLQNRKSGTIGDDSTWKDVTT